MDKNELEMWGRYLLETDDGYPFSAKVVEMAAGHVRLRRDGPGIDGEAFYMWIKLDELTVIARLNHL